MIRKLTHKLSLLDPRDPYRTKMTDALIEKCYQMGLLTAQKSLSQCDKITVSSFCRRRLPVIMVRLKMNLEDFVTWVDASKIKKKVLKYNNKLDDFDLLF